MSNDQHKWERPHGQFRRDGIIPDEEYEGKPTKGVKFPYGVSFGENSEYILRDIDQLNKLIKDFFKLLDVVEGAAMFDEGVAGDESRKLLQEIGVWKKS